MIPILHLVMSSSWKPSILVASNAHVHGDKSWLIAVVPPGLEHQSVRPHGQPK